MNYSDTNVILRQRKRGFGVGKVTLTNQTFLTFCFLTFYMNLDAEENLCFLQMVKFISSSKVTRVKAELRFLPLLCLTTWSSFVSDLGALRCPQGAVVLSVV